MELEKIGIITFLGKVTGIRYVGLFSDSDKILQAANYHTGRFVDYVDYKNEPIYEANEEQKQFFFNALAKENKYYCEKTKTIKEMKKEFTKKDLKSGMWIECMNGNRYLLMNNASDEELWGFRYKGKLRLSDYMDDLTFKFDEWNIQKVWHYDNPMDALDVDFNFGADYLIWERETEEDKQMKEMQNKLEEMKKAYKELEKNISETLDKLNKLKK